MGASDERLPAAPGETGTSAEIGSLARELAGAYRRAVTYYQTEMGMTPADADARWTQINDSAAFSREQVARQPGHEVTWSDLTALIEHDPNAGYAEWERIKAEARHDLASGHRAAMVLEYHSHRPWQRAQFLAIRAALIDEWQPRGGLELTLIDTLAQAHHAYLYWLARLHERAEGEGIREDQKLKQAGYWQPPRIEAAAALEQAATMADRFNRLFLRTLRALRDLRRYTPAVVVQHAGQVNVGSQQINVAGATKGKDEEDRE